ncbi:MAG: four helix bundle protein [Bacteroidota bacterium]
MQSVVEYGRLGAGEAGVEEASGPYADLSERLLAFAVRACNVAEALPHTLLGKHVAGQLIRSATSPMANYEEACAAESKKDFIHKLGLCLKELREARSWLRFTAKATLLPDTRLDAILDEATQLCKILGRSIATAKGLPKPDPLS